MKSILKCHKLDVKLAACCFCGLHHFSSFERRQCCCRFCSRVIVDVLRIRLGSETVSFVSLWPNYSAIFIFSYKITNTAPSQNRSPCSELCSRDNNLKTHSLQDSESRSRLALRRAPVDCSSMKLLLLNIFLRQSFASAYAERFQSPPRWKPFLTYRVMWCFLGDKNQKSKNRNEERKSNKRKSKKEDSEVSVQLIPHRQINARKCADLIWVLKWLKIV